MSSYKVDEYRLTFWSSRSTGDVNAKITVAAISLYVEGVFKGRAFFYPDGATLDPPDEGANGLITLYYNLSQYHAIMDTLRNEQPVYVYYYSAGNAGISTSKEPIDEEENSV